MAESGSLTVYPGAYSQSDSHIGSISNAIGPVGKGTANNGGAVVRAVRSEDSYIWWPFDLSSIPEKASIDSVSCSAAVMRPHNSATGSVQLASGTTLKGASVALAGVGSKMILTITNTGAWTRDELRSCRLKLSIYSDSSTGSNRDFTFYGADLTVTYTYQNEKFMLRIGSEENLLPEGYTRLEYIKSSGAQYANLAFSPNGNTSIEAKYNSVSTDNTLGCIIGSDAGWLSNECSIYLNVLAFGQTSVSRSTATGEDVVVKIDKGVGYIDGTQVLSAAQSFTSSYPLFVAALNRNGSATEYFSGIICYVKAYDNGTLIRDCYPCLNPSNVPGLYDLVNGVFYPSATSTPFVAGPVYNKVWRDIARVFKKISGIWVEQEELANVVDQTKRLANGGEYVVELPEGYTRLEYIEGTGAEYIDTQVSGELPVSVSMKIRTGTGMGSTDTVMCGVYQGSSGCMPVYFYNGQWVVSVGSVTGVSPKGYLSDNTDYVVESNMTVDSYELIVNGTSILKGAISGGGNTNALYLFARHDGNGVATRIARGRLYYCKIRRGKTFVRNYVPALRADGAVGLYDTVSGAFYGSSAGGSFVPAT